LHKSRNVSCLSDKIMNQIIEFNEINTNNLNQFKSWKLKAVSWELRAENWELRAENWKRKDEWTFMMCAFCDIMLISAQSRCCAYLLA
jgi:hypothetical protein